MILLVKHKWFLNIFWGGISKRRAAMKVPYLDWQSAVKSARIINLTKHNSLPNWWLFQMSFRFFFTPQNYGLLVDELLLLLILNVNIKTNRRYSTLIHWKPWFGAVPIGQINPNIRKGQTNWQSEIIKFFEPFTASVKHYATCISQFILS